MNYSDKLNEYIKQLNCTAKELSDASGLSPATLSRYRSGERVPEINSQAFNKVCSAIVSLSQKSNSVEKPLSEKNVTESFLECPDLIATDNEQFRQKLNTLISVMNINITKLCKHTNYESSALFRIRNGSRNPSDPVRFSKDIAGFVVREMNDAKDKKILQKLIGCSDDDMSDTAKLFDRLREWLIAGQSCQNDNVSVFLEKLNNFDMNEYIKAIHFDELKVPTVPFQLPTSKTYSGIRDMMTSEIDFLRSAVLSRSTEPVIMYSDMPMEEMSKDAEFPKKWLFGVALLLKKGLHLDMIHNIDRPFNEMMLGLESWIPMYMTGQVTPYYLRNAQNNVFMHFLKVAGTVALSGEAISGFHSEGKYYLTKNKDEVAYYRKRAEELLGHASPLMEIYNAKDLENLNAFLISDAYTKGKRRSILSAPPIYTMDNGFLNDFLYNHHVSDEDRQRILDYAETQKQIIEKILQTEVVEDEIAEYSKEEFQDYPAVLSLSGMFYEKDISYTYDEYAEHIRLTKEFEKSHQNYNLRKTSVCAFRNLQIHIHEGKWAMVSKSKSPAIHFVIYHRKLCDAIERFVPPIIDK